MWKTTAFLVALVPSALFAAGPKHFDLTAVYTAPAKAGASGAIAVTFVPTDPDVHVNEAPAPRLTLDPAQTLLVDKQAPAPDRVVPYDPDTAESLDLTFPVLFPVAIAKGAPKGAHPLAASVTYFYCSKRAGWCRKGTTEVSVSVTVP